MMETGRAFAPCAAWTIVSMPGSPSRSGGGMDPSLGLDSAGRYAVTNVASDPYTRSASLFLPKRRSAAAVT